MSDTNHFTGLPVPAYKEDPSGPGAFSAFRAALGGHTVLYADSEANRDALYLDAPVGSLCSSTAGKVVWMKTGLPNTWETLYSDTGWVSMAGAEWKPDWSDDGSAYRVINNQVYLDIRALYSGSEFLTPDHGNMTNLTVVHLPVDAQAGRTTMHVQGVYTYQNISGTFEIYQSSGNFTLATAMPNNTWATGNRVYATAAYLND